MTATIYPFLTFENARAAMQYYVEQFGAEIIYRQPLSAQQAENLGLSLEDLDATTAHGEFAIAGQKILCADATMGNPQTSSMVALLLDFDGDETVAKALFDRLAADEKQRVTLPFGPHELGGKLGQIVDQYGITWMISAGVPKEGVSQN